MHPPVSATARVASADATQTNKEGRHDRRKGPLNPAVVWISESRKKVVEQDDKLLRLLGIKISPEKLLPDVILADTVGVELLFVFVEVVSTDGPIHEERRAALLKLITDAGFKPEQAAFVTAFQSRDHAAFKKTVASLAWSSFAWCFSVSVRRRPRLCRLDGGDQAGAALLAALAQFQGRRLPIRLAG